MIVGTRPEAIKLEPVAAALSRRSLKPTIFFTGQHPKMDPADYRLETYSRVHLRCPRRRDPNAHVGAICKSILPALLDARPDLVIVQGDTSSALGGTLAAGMAGLPVAHVEAGLRSHDRRRPWPEEEFRVAIDAQAELLFAPTALSAANLRRERVPGQIHVTGNSGIDAVLNSRRGSALDRPDTQLPRILVTCHRRENWGKGISGIAAALQSIAADGLAKIDVVLHPNPTVAGQMLRLLQHVDGITFRGPAGHAETVTAMLDSNLLLSDSGGIQEEAATLGVPLLVLRDKTERPEAIACGRFELVGTDCERIVSAVKRRLRQGSPARAPALPYGNGTAGERIAAIVEEWLGAPSDEALTPAGTAIPCMA